MACHFFQWKKSTMAQKGWTTLLHSLQVWLSEAASLASNSTSSIKSQALWLKQWTNRPSVSWLHHTRPCTVASWDAPIPLFFSRTSTSTCFSPFTDTKIKHLKKLHNIELFLFIFFTPQMYRSCYQNQTFTPKLSNSHALLDFCRRDSWLSRRIDFH